MDRRVAITGIGVVSPVGTGKDAFWRGLLEGRCGVGTVRSFDASGYASRIAAEVKDFDPAEYTAPKNVKHMSRCSQFALAAAVLAKKDAGLDLNGDAQNAAVILGVSTTSMQDMEKEISSLISRGTESVNPFSAAKSFPNASSGHIGIELGLGGETITVSTGCSAGTNAIGYAYRNVLCGFADIVFAGGAEAPITPVMMSCFGNSRALSQRNADPAHASRPFDRNRDGWVLGEGAAILVLEEMSRASRREARIYAEISGYACTNDGYSLIKVDPVGDHAARALAKALKEARVDLDEVDYVNAHGSSSVVADRRETRVLKKVLGERAYKVPVSSLKSMTGHPLGACGGLQTAACALAISEDKVPPTINYEEPDEECDLDYVPNEARERRVRAAVNQALGIGGNNACLVLKKV